MCPWDTFEIIGHETHSYCLLRSEMLTLAAWVVFPYLRMRLAGDTFRYVIKVPTALDLSPFVRHSVYDEPKTRRNITENIIINSPAQDTSALQPNVFLSRAQQLPVINI
jgi:hypothetical protein